MVAAVANKAKGAGYETYDKAYTSVTFLNIENIHAVSASWKKLLEICQPNSGEGFHGKLEQSGEIPNSHTPLFHTLENCP